MELLGMQLEDVEEIKPILLEEFDDFWNSNILEEELKNKSRKYIVAKENKEILGFAGISIASGDAVELMNIVVRKDKRRSGIGTALLNEIIKIAKKTNLEVLTLEVNVNNLSAITLYENFGFERIGIRKKYYKMKDDAIIMNLKLLDIFKVALLQLNPTDSMENNKIKGIEYCKKAKEMGADIVVFPELWNTGYEKLFEGYLKDNNNISKEKIEQVLQELGIDNKVRGEALTIEQFADIVERI